MSTNQKNDFPLFVDLDGTLIKTDLLQESFLALIRNKPFYIFKVLFWLIGGRAKLKSEIAKRVELDLGNIPLNKSFFSFLEEEKKKGRKLILATATNELLAKNFANQTGLFSQVLASSESKNLKAEKKLSAIKKLITDEKFAYAGNSSADLAIWKEASEKIVVSASPAIVRKVKALDPEAKVFDLKPQRLKPLIKALRIYQWVKNLLIFLPLLLAHKLADCASLKLTVLAFIAFSLCASSVYLLNDLLDLQADRRHKKKKNRPFASGALPISWGMALGPLLFLASILLALKVNSSFVSILLTYYLLTTSYSFYLKKRLAVDVILLSSLYTIRILAGGVATDIVISEWLLSFSTFIFLSLALAKRYAELKQTDLSEGKSLSRRGYQASDLEVLANLGSASGYISILVLALYIKSPEMASLYHRPEALWLLCPLFLYWISRFWIFASRGLVNEDPIVFAAKDKGSWFVALVTGIFLYIAI